MGTSGRTKIAPLEKPEGGRDTIFGLLLRASTVLILDRESITEPFSFFYSTLQLTLNIGYYEN